VSHPALKAVEETDGIEQFDAIVVGAGVAGLYQLYTLLQAGLSVCCLEEASGIGGVWFWNRYPGCALDTATETYGYSFSEELGEEWNWKHYFSFQPEIEAYLNFVADKFELRRHIRLNSHVTSAAWNEDGHFWEAGLASGERVRGSFYFSHVGQFAAAFVPPFAGADRFRGETYHPARWPRESPDFTGKRVAVIGTGATAMQLIPHVAQQSAHLTVFQRTPCYGIPSDNGPVDPDVQREWKTQYTEIHRQIREGIGLRVTPDPRRGRDVPKEERLALYEEAWKRRGFEKFAILFHDLLEDREILEEYSEFLRGKIRARVDDPVVAEKLVPKDFLFQAKRTPLESNYYETFNRENVLLVSVRDTPIKCVTETGIRTSNRDYEFDAIIYATGFDTVTGPYQRVDVRGVDGQSLREKWEQNGLSSYLGLTTVGFPNFFKHLPALCPSATICVEWTSEWFTDTITYMREHGYTRIEPTQEAEDAWGEHVAEKAKGAIFGDVEYSWYTGSNIPGKRRQLLLYTQTPKAWREEAAAVVADGYDGFAFDSLEQEQHDRAGRRTEEVAG
jgi:cation diffusion facilitator CzcD-associated flavoprotein CzcO